MLFCKSLDLLPTRMRRALFNVVLVFTALASGVIDADNSGVAIETIEFLVDNSRHLTLERVEKSKRFQTADKNLNFGYSNGNVWVKIKLASLSARESRYFLELQYPLLDDITFYYPAQNNEYQAIRNGDSMHFENRQVKYQNPVFIFDTFGRSDVLLFLKVSSSSALQVPLKFMTSQQFAESIANQRLVFGIYYGVMVVMVLFNLFVYASVRDRSYLYYVFYIATYTLFAFSLNGLAFQYLWPGSSNWANYSVSFFIGLAGASLLFFTRAFLNTARKLPGLDWVLLAVACINLAASLATFAVPYSIIIKIEIALSAITVVLLFFTGF